jgi:hypothetical protein
VKKDEVHDGDHIRRFSDSVGSREEASRTRPAPNTTRESGRKETRSVTRVQSVSFSLAHHALALRNRHPAPPAALFCRLCACDPRRCSRHRHHLHHWLFAALAALQSYTPICIPFSPSAMYELLSPQAALAPFAQCLHPSHCVFAARLLVITLARNLGGFSDVVRENAAGATAGWPRRMSSRHLCVRLLALSTNVN